MFPKGEYSRRARGIAFLLILAGSVLSVYSNVLHGPFLFDDKLNISKNIHICVDELSIDKLWTAGTKSPCSNRPFANISFAMNLFVHGYNTFGYHLVNIFMHMLTGIFLYFFIKNTLMLCEENHGETGDPHYSLVSFFVALIWLVHPIQTQSVSYIVQRMTSMAGMFYILSMLLYLRGRLADNSIERWALFGGCTLSGILALGSKEIAATLPGFIFLYEWYFFQKSSASWLKRQIIPLVAVSIAVLLLGVIYFKGDPFTKLLSEYATREFTLMERVYTEFRVVVYYISLLILPHPSRLNLDYSFPISHSLIDPPTTILSILVIGFLAALSLFLAKRDRLVSFGIIWFLGNLVIESSVVGLELVYEHRLYIPSILFVAIGVVLTTRYVKPKWALIILLCSISAVFSLWTFQRNLLWTDEVSLWQDCVKKSPDKARVHINLGWAFYDKGMVDEAIREYDKAIQLDPGNVVAINHKGVALSAKGKSSDAVNLFMQAVKRFPNSSNTYMNLGSVLMMLGRYDEAIGNYEKAIQLEPNNDDAHYDLGMARARKGNMEGAVACYKRALHINPYSADAHINLGLAFANKGNIPGAIEHFSQAIKINPKNVKALNNLGLAMIEEGRLQDAQRYYSRAFELDPEDPDSNCGLGTLLMQKGDLDRALFHFKRALRKDPNTLMARENLTHIEGLLRKYEAEALPLKTALNNDPGNTELNSRLGALCLSVGKFQDAIGYYKKALESNQRNITAQERLSIAFKQAGEYENALICLLKIRNLQPNNPAVYYNISCIYSQQGNVEDSIEWLNKALARGFNDLDLLSKDSDLENIRKTKQYEDIKRKLSLPVHQEKGYL